MKNPFDPFNERLCRDIRNNLSEGLMQAIAHCSMAHVNRAANQFFKMELAPHNSEYINNRIAGYTRIINKNGKTGQDDVFCIAALIWDEGLFFEVHDYLEQRWIKATGERKMIYQALIRAAGTYVHLEQQKMKGARGMADKAVKSLMQCREHIPLCINLDLLIRKLQDLDPILPRIQAEEH